MLLVVLVMLFSSVSFIAIMKGKSKNYYISYIVKFVLYSFYLEFNFLLN